MDASEPEPAFRNSAVPRSGRGRADLLNETTTLHQLRASGRAGASIYAACCAERLRPLLRQVPSGAAPLVAGVALTELWRVLEGMQRPEVRRLEELSKACWALVEFDPVPGVRTELLEALVAAAHGALETYLSGNPQKAIAAAKSCRAVRGADHAAQDRDLAEIAAAGQVVPQLATRLRQRAEAEGEALLPALLAGAAQ